MKGKYKYSDTPRKRGGSRRSRISDDESFWDVYKPGCDEHLVGNIIYSEAFVINGKWIRHEVVTFGPLRVLPGRQNKGVGYALVERTKQMAAEMGGTLLS